MGKTDNHGSWDRISQNHRRLNGNEQMQQGVKPKKSIKYESISKSKYAYNTKNCPYCNFIGQDFTKTHKHIAEAHDKIFQKCPHCAFESHSGSQCLINLHITSVHDLIMPIK